MAIHFELDQLKVIAMECMLENIDQFTMYEYANFAMKHLLEAIKIEVIRFMEPNLPTISQTQEWLKLDPSFRLEAFQYFFDDQCEFLKIEKKFTGWSKIWYFLTLQNNCFYL